MPVFQYEWKKTNRGKWETSLIAADSPRHARDILRARGIAFENLKPSTQDERQKVESARSTDTGFAGIQWISSLLSRWNGKRLGSQVTWFIREMATLLRVGTPMLDALDLAIQQCSKRFQQTLMDLRERIRSGTSLADSFKMHPYVFDSLLIEMVHVGEKSGALATVMVQASEFRERRDKLKDRVLSALLYPMLVLTLSIGVTIFLMTAVVPALIQSLQEMQRELPLPTLLLKSVSDFLVTNGAFLAIAVLLMVGATFAYTQTGSGSLWRDRMLLRTPLLGKLIVKQNCSRLCLVTSTLLKSGVELVRSLEIAEGSMNNRILASVISQARDRIASGAELGTALSNNKYIPAGLIQVFSLGQSTGELDILLMQIAHDYDAQVNTLADRLTTVLEPLLIVGLSIVVGFILLATLLPILETGNALAESQ